MRLYPAIDILEGSAVRLTKGHFEQKKVYDQHPLSVARKWVAEGARRLHVVDLDGARAGHPVNLDAVAEILADDRVGVPVQLGGGLRFAQAIDDAFALGIDRAIVGTAAFKEPEVLALSARWHGRISIAIDVREGKIAVDGWTRTLEGGPEAIAQRLAALSADHFIYTNVDRDGMLAGPNLEEIASLAAVIPGSFTYSGGIGDLSHLRALRELGLPNLSGVIVGKALYEARFTIAEAQQALGE